MNLKFNRKGELLNPCVQLNTSIFSMQKNGADISEDAEPVFYDGGDDAKCGAAFFKDSDPLYYRSYDPFEVAANAELQKSKDLSSMNANNINAVNNQ